MGKFFNRVYKIFLMPIEQVIIFFAMCVISYMC